MDPITLAIITGIITAAGGSAGAIWLLHRWLKGRHDHDQLPPPPDSSPTTGEESNPLLTDEQLIASILAHLSLARRQVIVGYRQEQGPVTGFEIVEPGYLTGESEIRFMRDMSELPYMIPGQDTGDELLDLVTLALGERLVEVPIERVPVHSRLEVPITRWAEQIIYLLVDFSPSMYPSHDPWKTPIWRGLCVKLLEHALHQGITVRLRFFDNGVSRLYEAKEPGDYHNLISVVRRVNEGSGTDITNALHQAIEDLQIDSFDAAQIMIITDGEDRSLSAVDIRQRLDDAGVTLHAVMLGIDNQSLASASHKSQRIPEAGRIDPLQG